MDRRGLNEKGYNAKSGELLVEVDEKYFGQQRLSYYLVTLPWLKRSWLEKGFFSELVSDMVKYDLSEGYGGLE